jgi:hypothetical protein
VILGREQVGEGTQLARRTDFLDGGSRESRPRPYPVPASELAVELEHAVALEGGIEEVAESDDLGQPLAPL